MSRKKSIRHLIEYAGVRTVVALTSLLPLRLATALGALLGWKAYRVFGVRRRVSVDNIRRSLGYADTKAAAGRIACAAYMNSGRSFVEYALFGRLNAEKVRQIVAFEGLHHFDRALEHGRGAILFTGHFGNWELLGAGIAAHGYPIHFLVGEQTNPRVDSLMNDLRRRHNIGIISRDVALRKVLRALKDNQFVALLADQDARRSGVFVDFLGRPASTVKGPAMFSIKNNSPIIPGFIRRVGGARHHAELQEPLWPNPDLEGEEAIVDLTQRYTDRLADAIRRYPAEYFWAHRRWKTTPGSDAGGKGS